MNGNNISFTNLFSYNILELVGKSVGFFGFNYQKIGKILNRVFQNFSDPTTQTIIKSITQAAESELQIDNQRDRFKSAPTNCNDSSKKESISQNPTKPDDQTKQRSKSESDLQ